MRAYSIHTVLGVAVAVVLLAGCGAAESVQQTTDAAPLVELSLDDDGLGDVLLGFPPETVISDISAIYGEGDSDSQWIQAEPNIYGSCPGTQMRAVGWGSLVVIFIRDDVDALGGRFYTYTYGYDYSENAGGVDPRELGLTTAAGIGLGSTVGELADAYGATAVIEGDTDLDVWSFRIEGSEIRGLVSGPERSDTVTLIELTTGCS